MPDCPTCGLPYSEGDTLCPQCGGKLPVKVKTVTCKICGNMLNETAEFCNICGTPTENKKKEEEEIPKEDLSNPTMDEIQIPVITDDTPGLQEVSLKDENTPTMDSIYMPGEAPAVTPAPVIEEVQAVAPTPAKPATAPITPTVAETPKVREVQANPAANAAASAQTVITPEGKSVVQPQANAEANGQNAQNSTAANTPYVPHATHNPNVVPGKKISDFLPIILIIAIVLVILIDVFVVFRKQIFGGSDTNSGCAAVTAIAEEDYPFV